MRYKYIFSGIFIVAIVGTIFFIPNLLALVTAQNSSFLEEHKLKAHKDNILASKRT